MTRPESFDRLNEASIAAHLASLRRLEAAALQAATDNQKHRAEAERRRRRDRWLWPLSYVVSFAALFFSLYVYFGKGNP